MAAICFCGVCIPYNAIWPIILIAAKYVERVVSIVLCVLCLSRLSPPPTTLTNPLHPSYTHHDYRYLWDWFQVHVLGREVKPKAKAVNGVAAAAGTSSCCSDKDTATKSCANLRGTATGKSDKYPATHFYLTEEHNLSDILTDAPTLLKFTASWCKPCKKVEPFVDELSRQEEYKHIHFVSIDVDEHEDIMSEYSVTGIPVFVCMHGEREFSRMTGADEGKLMELLQAAYSN